eukprot:TRINITY_DN8574_c0_g1_i1.p1 TRINITY_DN8574_c0_g1~~TRINITY_DN8574_c0_g1_i1.p1  ORF type:complete len:182 (+),score=42.11 TRINITY_DN8574_c0_g1_i1:43-588(+)
MCIRDSCKLFLQFIGREASKLAESIQAGNDTVKAILAEANAIDSLEKFKDMGYTFESLIAASADELQSIAKNLPRGCRAAFQEAVLTRKAQDTNESKLTAEESAAFQQIKEKDANFAMLLTSLGYEKCAVCFVTDRCLSLRAFKGLKEDFLEYDSDDPIDLPLGPQLVFHAVILEMEETNS